ncbi:MAG: OsmC family protein [Rhodocyclaceae bacterium]
MSKGLNGIDIEAMQGYVDAVKADANMAAVKFVAKSTWKGGTRCDATVTEFYANGQPASQPGRSFTVSMDEPPPLGGSDQHPNPAEMLAAALCGCLTAGIAANAALFGTEIDSLEVETEIDWNMLGLLGLDRDVSCGAKAIHYTVRLKGKGDREHLLRSKETLDRKSAVLNSFLLPIPVSSETVVEGLQTE